MTETTLPRHTELPAQYTWNAPGVFPSGEAWEDEWKQVSAGLAEYARKYQGHLADSAALVFECLQMRDEILRSRRSHSGRGIAVALPTTH